MLHPIWKIKGFMSFKGPHEVVASTAQREQRCLNCWEGQRASWFVVLVFALPGNEKAVLGWGWEGVQLYLAKGVSDVPSQGDMVLGKLSVPLSCSFTPNQLPGNSRHL